MELVEQRKVVHAGTYNGNPVSLAAANLVLGILEEDGGSVLAEIRRRGETLIAGLRDLARAAGLLVLVNGVGSVFHLCFTDRKEMNGYADTLQVDLGMRDRFIEGMLDAGIYLLPDGRWYVSAAHTEDEVRTTLKIVAELFDRLAMSTRVTTEAGQ